jgi:hypothetical protein
MPSRLLTFSTRSINQERVLRNGQQGADFVCLLFSATGRRDWRGVS